MVWVYEQVGQEVAAHGLALRGGFAAEPADALPHAGSGRPVVTVLMIGNTARAMWEAFARSGVTGPHPLDRWTRSVIEPIASRHGARAVYPHDAPPWPFQRWAARAWPLSQSPLGLLIDPEFGLWHALRAALLFDHAVEFPTQATRPQPCVSCAAKPCLTACPVDAFANGQFDYAGCRSYLATPSGDACLAHGCKARVACPVGAAHRYDAAQLQFHMRAYSGVGRKG